MVYNLFNKKTSNRNRNSKTLKYHIFSKKTLLFSSICSNCGSKDEKMFKEEESTKILKILDLINNIEEYQKI